MQPVTDPNLIEQLNQPNVGMTPVDPELARMLDNKSYGEQSFEGRGFGDQMAIGMGKSARQTQLGIKDIFTNLSNEEQNELEMMEGISGGPALVGEILADIGGMIIPGSAALKMGKFAKYIPKLSENAAKAILAMGSNVGYEAAKAPTANQSRGERAGYALAGDAILRGGGKVLTKTLAPKISSKAQELMDSGVDLTIGQAADQSGRYGRGVRWVEDKLASLPAVGGSVENRQREALEGFNQKIINDINPTPPDINATGAEGFSKLQSAFSDAYKDVWNKVDPWSVDRGALTPELTDVQGFVKEGLDFNVPVSEQPEVIRLLKVAGEEWKEFVGGNRSVASLDRVDDMLRGTNLDDASQRFLKDVRKMYRNMLPEEAGQKLAALDRKYVDYSTLEKAGAYKTSLEDDLVSPGSLLTASAQKGGPRQAVTGSAPLQRTAQDAVEVLGSKGPGRNILRQTLALPATAVGLGTFPTTTAAILGLGNAAYSKPGQRAMTRGFDALGKQSLTANILRLGPKAGAASWANKEEE